MTDEQQRQRPDGATMRRGVLGQAHVERSARGRDPFMEPFHELATEHVWGALWNRPGLDPKYRSLVVIAALAALGRLHELRLHLRGGLNVGWTADELREVCLQLGGYVGYPAALDALRTLVEVLHEHDSDAGR
jgi:4-carboxymuconolactone decarboxylase